MKSRALRHIACLFFVLLSATAVANDDGNEVPLVRVTFEAETPGGRSLGERTTEGQILVTAQDGGFLLLDRTGRIWSITPDRLTRREETGETFTPFTQEEMAAAMQAELGDEFEIVTTKHYILCTQASRDYARWAGMLFERLMAAFLSHWDRRPLEVHEPEFPLCAIILKDKQHFQEFAIHDAGPGVLDALGYYSTFTNRMVMYDLTAGLSGRRPQNVIELNNRLRGQIANVSTIVHEATHQIAFNSGLHVRLAENPFWLVEGMAMYFETPDLRNAAGWRSVGQENGSRLRQFRQFATTRRPADSLRTMLTEDEQFHAPDTALDAYSEAWALTYYLIKQKRAEYMNYLKLLSEKEPLHQDTSRQRLADFESAFGEIEQLEQDFAKYARIRWGR